MKRIRTMLIGMFLVVIARSGFADLTIERKVTLSVADPVNHKERIVRKEVVKIKDGNIKIEDVTFGDALIIRDDKKIVWKIDTLGGTYSELSFDRIIQRRREIIEEIKSTRKAIENTDEAKILDKIVADMGDAFSGTSLEVQDVGASEQIAGVTCKRIKITAGKNHVLMDGWVAQEFEEGTQYFKTLVHLGALPPALLDRLNVCKGVMLKGTLYNMVFFANRVTESVETSAVSKAALKAGEFDLPANLKQVPLAGFEELPEREVQKPKTLRRDFYEDELEKKANPLQEEK